MAGIVHLGFITEEEEKEIYCIEQMKSMYGNDAALIYFKLFKRHLIGLP
jgi:hypothetical protein